MPTDDEGQLDKPDSQYHQSRVQCTVERAAEIMGVNFVDFDIMMRHYNIDTSDPSFVSHFLQVRHSETELMQHRDSHLLVPIGALSLVELDTMYPEYFPCHGRQPWFYPYHFANLKANRQGYQLIPLYGDKFKPGQTGVISTSVYVQAILLVYLETGVLHLEENPMVTNTNTPTWQHSICVSKTKNSENTDSIFLRVYAPKKYNQATLKVARRVKHTS